MSSDRKSIWLLPINLDVLAIYDEVLALDNKLKIHQRHLQFLGIEIYKFKSKLNPSFMWKTYKEKNIPYSLRRGISLLIPNANTQKYEITSLNFRGSVTCSACKA